jgi:hypothetical protein
LFAEAAKWPALNAPAKPKRNHYCAADGEYEASATSIQPARASSIYLKHLCNFDSKGSNRANADRFYVATAATQLWQHQRGERAVGNPQHIGTRPPQMAASSAKATPRAAIDVAILQAVAQGGTSSHLKLMMGSGLSALVRLSASAGWTSASKRSISRHQWRLRMGSEVHRATPFRCAVKRSLSPPAGRLHRRAGFSFGLKTMKAAGVWRSTDLRHGKGGVKSLARPIEAIVDGDPGIHGS